MKIKKRLYPHEAELLGFKTKKNIPGRNQASYYLKKSQWELIVERRTTPAKREFVETQVKKRKERRNCIDG